jgi:choline dehydrogenase-like flavoprotein
MAIPTNRFPMVTDFTRDVLGRYVCNGLDEKQNSEDKADPQNPRPDARRFDIIVLGGGTFGSAVASYLLEKDKTHSHRILLLEAGPFLLTEHVQNFPMLGLNTPDAVTLEELMTKSASEQYNWQKEVWGLPWRSNLKFPGLAYCLGGRSLYFGGWSPELLPSEMPLDKWPASVVSDFVNPMGTSPSYFHQASDQIGTSETNDFIFGPLHEALRKRLFEGINSNQISDAIPLADLPDHPALQAQACNQHAIAELQSLLGLNQTPAGSLTKQDLCNMLKLEAPLAVKASDLPGFFPFNKFSSMQILIKAARQAVQESGGDDVKKRLMVVPFCHVKMLASVKEADKWRVTGIEADLGGVPVGIPVPNGGTVIIAMGTIESTRLALLSFADPRGVNITNSSLIGKNLMAHLRSNLTIRIPRTDLDLDPSIQALQTSALFLKGRHQHQDGSFGHFHLQITASGGNTSSMDSEAKLFKKVPDIDTLDVLRKANDSNVVITIRGIGQMDSQNPGSNIALSDPNDIDFGFPRARIQIQPNNKDLALWDAMDRASDDVAQLFMNGLNSNADNKVLTSNGIMERIPPGATLKDLVPYTPGRRDGLGTTHHETGTLWMGDDPMGSVTNPDGRFHFVTNAYVASPALIPATGSPNPMLTGIALARRLADHLVSKPVPPETTTDGFTLLFNGFDASKWRMSTIDGKDPGGKNPGRFIIVDGTLESVPGDGLGLLWYTVPMPADYIIRLEWLRWQDNGNSGVFVRFPHPDSKGYTNTAWVGVNFGFEVQIDEFDAPDGLAIHKTGAIYNEPNQNLTQIRARPAGDWNDFEIRVEGQTYTVFLNGAQVTEFQNLNPNRGLPSTSAEPSFIGLQSYANQVSRVAFRNIRIKSL